MSAYKPMDDLVREAAAEKAAMQIANLSYTQMLTYFPPKESAGS